MPRSSTTLCIVLFGLLVSSQCISASTAGAEPRPVPPSGNRIQILFGRVLHSFRNLIRHLRNECMAIRDKLVSAVSSCMGASARSTFPSSDNTRNLSITHQIALPGSDPGRHLQIAQFLRKHDIDLVVGETAGYEVVDKFDLTGYDIGAVIQAIRHEYFHDNVCMKGCQDVIKGDWTTEGVWLRRSVEGTVPSNSLITPRFVQIHRYGYVTESSAVYVVSQDINVLTAWIHIRFRIQLEQHLPADAVRIQTSFKVEGSGNWLIASQGKPHARRHARQDYQQAKPVLINILHNNVISDTPGDTVIMPELGLDLDRSCSSASAAAAVDQAGDDTDLQANGAGQRAVIAVRWNLTRIRSLLMYIVTLALAMITASAKYTQHG